MNITQEECNRHPTTHHNLMFVQKRDETKEEVCVDKIATRIKKMCYGLTSGYVDPVPPRRLLTTICEIHLTVRGAVCRLRLPKRWYRGCTPASRHARSTSSQPRQVRPMTPASLPLLPPSFAAAYMATQHPDLATLAARISISSMHKQTQRVFTNVIRQMHAHVHPVTKAPTPLVATDVYDIAMQHADTINSAIIHDRDFM